jgi:hypothetical protein
MKGLAGAAMLLLAACGGDSSPIDALGGGQETVEPPVDVVAIPLTPGPGINGRNDWFGAQSAANMDILVTARDERSWRILWQLVGSEPPGELPEGAMAIGVFLGQRSSGGYTAAFESVSLAEGQVIARYIETTPPADAIVSQALTSPYAVRLVRANGAPIQFVRIGS